MATSPQAAKLGSIYLIDLQRAIALAHGLAAPAEAAVIVPAEGLGLPRASLRGLPSCALLRLQSGRIWRLRMTGHMWTQERLTAAAAILASSIDGPPDVVTLNRLGDTLGLPGIRVDIPGTEALDASTWNVRPLAVAGCLAHALAGGGRFPQPPTSAAVDEMVDSLRLALQHALGRFRSELKQDCLHASWSYGAYAFEIYNYLASDPTERNRLQFAKSIPLLLRTVALADTELAARLRCAIDASQPVAGTVCRAMGVGPSAFSGLTGVPLETLGPRWAEDPSTLMNLLNAVPPRCRPGKDGGAWDRLNELVTGAEAVTGQPLAASLAAQSWVRDALLRPTDAKSCATVTPRQQQGWDLIEMFRNEIYQLQGANYADRRKLLGRASHRDVEHQRIDSWLLKFSPRQLQKIATRWQAAHQEQKERDADLISCLRGERYWPLFPTPFVSSDGMRKIQPLITRDQLVSFGAAMENCLDSPHLVGYDAACKTGRTFILGLSDSSSGKPRSAAELRLTSVEADTVLQVELVQHTAYRNGLTDKACTRAMHEVLERTLSKPVQAHLRLGLVAFAVARKRKVSAAGAAETAMRLRTLRHVLGDAAFQDLCGGDSLSTTVQLRT